MGVVALLVFGPNKLPLLGAWLGRKLSGGGGGGMPPPSAVLVAPLRYKRRLFRRILPLDDKPTAP